MRGDETDTCKGCGIEDLVWLLSEDGYCDSCDFEHNDKQDNLTDGGDDESIL